MRNTRSKRAVLTATILAPALALTGGLAFAAGDSGNHPAPPSPTSQVTRPGHATTPTDRDDCSYYDTRTTSRDDCRHDQGNGTHVYRYEHHARGEGCDDGSDR
ncbi:hypothetical protein [Streptomyces dysideae]|uniref:Uncharacterized protein n=1 Tax=Streptomyces dysideae TaxID=909626 RepID=A0A101UST8_9ACTN|nr:hypothetical protein [Streptomyces dysideae]KUO16231.1 hypothetical protein AQJ91_37055 [Streptomyces dysideae]